jgi:hypothetical protein
MLLKNNSKSIQQFSLNKQDDTNAVVPRFLQIPAGATVEVEDVDWKTITSDLTRVQIYESTEEPIGTEEFGQAKIGKEALFKTVKVPTGRFQKVNLVLEKVKQGRLVVVEAPSTGLTLEQLVARINLVKGLSVDTDNFSKEELEEVYLENQHKIEAAVEARRKVKENTLEA